MKSAAKSKSGRFGRYALVGIGTNGTLYLTFLGLVWLGVAPLAASAMCYVLGVLASYVLNRSWTFASTSSHARDSVRFLVAYGIGLLVTMISMYLLVDPLGPAIAQFLTIGITAVAIFSTLELLKFGR